MHLKFQQSRRRTRATGRCRCLIFMAMASEAQQDEDEFAKYVHHVLATLHCCILEIRMS